MSFSKETKFDQCPECGGWVPFRQDEEDGKWKQSSACRPCWTIKNLRELLSPGTKVSQGESADTLRGKLQRAEAEIERLKGLLNTPEHEGDTPVAFCDFCSCKECRDGAPWLSHAQTEDGRWICDVCYQYDVCVSAQAKIGQYDGPCEDMNCSHRPRLVTEFTKYTKGNTP